jgi:hypothetical protein
VHIALKNLFGIDKGMRIDKRRQERWRGRTSDQDHSSVIMTFDFIYHHEIVLACVRNALWRAG